MINWSKIISDYNLHGYYGHFLVYAFGKPVDVVFWHFDHFEYDIYCPCLDSYSDLSSLEVVSINVHCSNNLDFWGCIILDKTDFISRFTSLLKRHGL